ncbi:signal peptidase I [candidate division CSSED10-310 bacterium]|uniref:Signal peptidase I n=1 Tax=candidate division CSSED10-310 bacterium TaxID=2855610 RepID=A0ABV6YVE4_UNCC1
MAKEKKKKQDLKNENKNEKTSFKTPLRENVEAIVVALILALFVRTFIFQAFKIPSGSMKDTLLIGDHILVNKSIYSSPLPYLNFSIFPIKEPARKDIIVFKYPKDPNRDFIKRCIATGNDYLLIKGQEIKVNDTTLDEPYAKYEKRYLQSYQSKYWSNVYNKYNERLPEGNYFMMGDNRDNSQDSRYWGLLDHDLIKGKAFLIYLSISDDEAPLWKKIRWDRFFKKIK